MRVANCRAARRTCWLGFALCIVVLLLPSCFLFNQSPAAQFTVSGELRPGIEISFINTSTDPDGNDDIVVCSWDFGDGTYADSFNAKHEYAQPGRYEVTLTVYDKSNNVGFYTMTIDVRSNIFGTPDLMYVHVGKSWASGTACGVFGVCIPESERYGRDPTNSYWIVDFPIFHDEDGSPYVIPENIVFWIPVRFADDLAQSLQLVMSWHLTDAATGEGLLYYSDPDEYVLGITSGITGINAMWDFWGVTEKEYLVYRPYGTNDMLPRGYYVVRLTILERQTGEKFIWDFPFRVCLGGC